MKLFNFKIDDEIKSMWFFKDEHDKFKKKNYVYITQENKIKIKGLPIIKSTCSKITQLVMQKLKPTIIKDGDIKFDKLYIENMVDELIKQDLTLVSKCYKVKDVSQYKNRNSIHAQISEQYGAGEHWLVPNNKIGKVGKSKKYCSFEEAKQLTIYDLDLDKIFNTELNIFIRDWQHPLFLKRLKRADEKFERDQEKELQDFFKGDLWDSEAVGDDISNREFFDNEMRCELE